MVIRTPNRRSADSVARAIPIPAPATARSLALRCSFGLGSTEAALMVELLVAIALLTGALLPLAYSLASEKRLARASYQRAVAMEIVDGEMEVLAAGEWLAFKSGTQDYQVHAAAATNLPPGRFVLIISTNRVRLEWRPELRMHGGGVIREVKIQ